MVESKFVVLVVAGSSPVGHPTLLLSSYLRILIPIPSLLKLEQVVYVCYM